MFHKESPLVSEEAATILVVDDERSVLELVSDVLLEANFKVLGASTAAEGIAVFQAHHMEVGLILLDYSMPDLNGAAAFEELARIDPRVPILISSGYTEEDMGSAFGQVRPAGFIHKPFSPAALLERIAEFV
jgi:DNA-binding response OmpR family regulator